MTGRSQRARRLVTIFAASSWPAARYLADGGGDASGLGGGGAAAAMDDLAGAALEGF